MSVIATDYIPDSELTYDIQRSLKDIKDNKIEFLENQSRRINIRVDSIPEDDQETWSSADIKLKHIVGEKLDLSFAPVIETAHRVGARPRSWRSLCFRINSG